MDGYTVGEIVELEDQREFICYKKIQDGDSTYLFMVSNFKPVEVFFAEEIVKDGAVCLRKIGSQEEKRRLLPLFGLDVPETETQKSQPEAAQPTTTDETTDENSICVGETLVLDKKGAYHCIMKIIDEGKEYLCLMSASRSIKFMFGEAVVDDSGLSVKVVKDPEKLRRLREYYRTHRMEGFKQLFQDRSKRKKLAKMQKKSKK